MPFFSPVARYLSSGVASWWALGKVRLGRSYFFSSGFLGNFGRHLSNFHQKSLKNKEFLAHVTHPKILAICKKTPPTSPNKDLGPTCPSAPSRYRAPRRGGPRCGSSERSEGSAEGSPSLAQHSTHRKRRKRRCQMPLHQGKQTSQL